MKGRLNVSVQHKNFCVPQTTLKTELLFRTEIKGCFYNSSKHDIKCDKTILKVEEDKSSQNSLN